ncbi:hypothetical protein [Streptomyces sp. NBC_01794]|uniref:hypothetical protein n=1 Tax=Streptomyces sp. NBC_01794 TaxID=2975942 RepID=UPI00308E065B|nr:hypothetical protein OIE54_40695 [Streptomyces sp. NBC_01794]
MVGHAGQLGAVDGRLFVGRGRQVLVPHAECPQQRGKCLPARDLALGVVTAQIHEQHAAGVPVAYDRRLVGDMQRQCGLADPPESGDGGDHDGRGALPFGIEEFQQLFGLGRAADEVGRWGRKRGRCLRYGAGTRGDDVVLVAGELLHASRSLGARVLLCAVVTPLLPRHPATARRCADRRRSA